MSNCEKQCTMQLFSGSFKILVAGGVSTTTGPAQITVEIINLDIASANCSYYPTFTGSNLVGAAGILDQQDQPLICGGGNDLFYSNFCFQLDGGSWVPSFNFSEPKMYSPIIKAPFKNTSRLFIMAGGYNPSTNSLLNIVEILTTSGWEVFTPSLPFAINAHCMVSLPYFGAMVIGGVTNGTYFGGTFIITNDNPLWTSGPSLKLARQYHACSRITNNSWNPKYSTIVVGGFNVNYLDSVEILDDNTNSWRNGPALPISVDGLSLVEDQRGGVIALGGALPSGMVNDLLYRLRNSEADKWELMPQKLKSPRKFFVAIIMPDYKVNCTYV